MALSSLGIAAVLQGSPGGFKDELGPAGEKRSSGPTAPCPALSCPILPSPSLPPPPPAAPRPPPHSPAAAQLPGKAPGRAAPAPRERRAAQPTHLHEGSGKERPEGGHTPFYTAAHGQPQRPLRGRRSSHWLLGPSIRAGRRPTGCSTRQSGRAAVPTGRRAWRRRAAPPGGRRSARRRRAGSAPLRSCPLPSAPLPSRKLRGQRQSQHAAENNSKNFISVTAGTLMNRESRVGSLHGRKDTE